MRWAVWRCFRGASRSAISHSSISSRYEPSFGAGRRSGRLRGGGSGEASAWRTARRWTPWRSARALIDRLSRSRSLLICSNVSTRDPIPVCRLPLELHEARTVGGESDGVGPFQGSAVGPSESSVPMNEDITTDLRHREATIRAADNAAHAELRKLRASVDEAHEKDVSAYAQALVDGQGPPKAMASHMRESMKRIETLVIPAIDESLWLLRDKAIVGLRGNAEE